MLHLILMTGMCRSGSQAPLDSRQVPQDGGGVDGLIQLPALRAGLDGLFKL